MTGNRNQLWLISEKERLSEAYWVASRIDRTLEQTFSKRGLRTPGEIPEILSENPQSPNKFHCTEILLGIFPKFTSTLRGPKHWHCTLTGPEPPSRQAALLTAAFFRTAHDGKKEPEPGSLRNVTDTPTESLNPDPRERIILIFRMMKWEVWISHFCCTPERGTCHKKKRTCGPWSRRPNVPLFSWNAIFNRKSAWHTSDLVFGRHLKNEQNEPVASRMTADRISQWRNSNLQSKHFSF